MLPASHDTVVTLSLPVMVNCTCPPGTRLGEPAPTFAVRVTGCPVTGLFGDDVTLTDVAYGPGLAAPAGTAKTPAMSSTGAASATPMRPAVPNREKFLFRMVLSLQRSRGNR